MLALFPGSGIPGFAPDGGAARSVCRATGGELKHAVGVVRRAVAVHVKIISKSVRREVGKNDADVAAILVNVGVVHGVAGTVTPVAGAIGGLYARRGGRTAREGQVHQRGAALSREVEPVPGI